MDVSRREFLKGLSAGALGAAALEKAGVGVAHGQDKPDLDLVPASGATLELTINGVAKSLPVEPRTTLLDLLRTRLGVTGPKEVCDRGACGACTVIIDGKPRIACMILAHDVAGKKITTVEGLGTPEKPHPLQKAFAECDALQCGFCTPGMVTTLACHFDGKPSPSLAEIKRAVAGNFCRCGTYTRIFEAAQKAYAGGAK
ncbi:MAG TPA: (2Fe-2S)-binding protein [Planctomycetota bacterium]|nr:(2Fe-2S)-binding protein [Planctomycetota bacterium]